MGEVDYVKSDTTRPMGVVHAIDAFEEAVARREEIEIHIRDARARIGQEIIEASMGLSQEDRWSIAAWAYWNTEARVHELAASVGVSCVAFVARVGKTSSGVRCDSCGEFLQVSSRSKRQELAAAAKGGRRHYWALSCENCRSKKSQINTAEWDRIMAAQQKMVERLRTMPYSEYLRTDHWQEIRRAKLRRAKYACQLCNSGGVLDVHHRTYERRGCEIDSDLIVLCRSCHGKFHDKVA